MLIKLLLVNNRVSYNAIIFDFMKYKIIDINKINNLRKTFLKYV